MKTFKKILVPTDFSELSLTAIEYVRRFVSTNSPQIVVMHVVENVPLLEFQKANLDSYALLQQILKRSSEELQRLVGQRLQSVKNLTCIVRLGHPTTEIVQFAEEEGVDLLVVATHGRTGLAHTLIGSVAENIVRRSTVPVLTVKPNAIRDAIQTSKHDTAVSSSQQISILKNIMSERRSR